MCVSLYESLRRAGRDEREDKRKKKGESWERQLREGTWEGNTGEGKGAGHTLTVSIFVMSPVHEPEHKSGCVANA